MSYPRPETANPFTAAKVIGHDIAPEVYVRQDPGVKRGDPRFVMSRSELMAFHACPRKWIDAPPEDKPTDAMLFGSLVDCLMLAPDAMSARFAIYPAEYPSEGRKGEEILKPWNLNATYCKQWRDAAKAEGKQPIWPEDVTRAQRAVARAKADAEVSELVACSKKQVMIRATYRDTGTRLEIPCKMLLDIVPACEHPEYGKTLWDWKTTTNGSKDAWTSRLFASEYHIQAAWFMDAYVAATGEDRTDWGHIVQESEPPFETTIWPLSCDFVAIGREKYLEALKHYAACLATGNWHGYNPKVARQWITADKPWMCD